MLDHLNRHLARDRFEVALLGGRAVLRKRGSGAAVVGAIADKTTTLDFGTVGRDLDRATRNAEDDPEDAVTAACATLEAVCRYVIWRHAFRPIRVPLVTVIGLSYAGLLEGSVMIETVFSWPGIGNYLTSALLDAEMNAVLGATLVIGAVFIGINKLSDLSYRLLDPRARA